MKGNDRCTERDRTGIREPRPSETAPEAALTGNLADVVAAAIEALSGNRHGLDVAARHVGATPGLYAIYAKAPAWVELGLGKPPDSRPLYVGKAEASLISRDLNTHFSEKGRTGSSTVRRSVAALLRDTLGLRGRPRNPQRPERPANYGLSEAHEAALGTWMRTHLSLATWPKPAAVDDLLLVEVAVIGHWSPPLNLKDNNSPWKPSLSTARKVMADDARAWAAERGHDI